MGKTEAIVLAGGFGTRLQHIVSDVPKPMAPMDAAGTPFLKFLLDELLRQGVDTVVLSTGYLSASIVSYFGTSYRGMRIRYSHENTPLFTGGAVKKAMQLCKEPEVFVMNGDTFFGVDLSAMLRQHRQKEADFTIAVKEMHDFDRYGTVVFDAQKRICSFRAKGPCSCGWINGGVYCLRQGLLQEFSANKFSLERDFMEKYSDKLLLTAFLSNGYFIDIGVPEDYYRARKELPSM